MDTSSLAPIYVAGIAFNVIAFAYAASNGQWLFSGAFGLVVCYLSVRYWMLASS